MSLDRARAGAGPALKAREKAAASEKPNKYAVSLTEIFFFLQVQRQVVGQFIQHVLKRYAFRFQPAKKCLTAEPEFAGDS
jgi:hypothetical protein